jgi:hypothetical protein
VRLAKYPERQRVRLILVMAEIDALRSRMTDAYERSGSLRDPLLIQLSEILDRRLNEFGQLQK